MDTGLRSHPRDVSILRSAGDAMLLPPSGSELVALACEHLVAADADPAARPASAVRTYLRWKPGVSTTAAYSVACGDGTRAIVVAKRYADGKAEQLEGRRERHASAVAGEGWHPRAVLADAGLVLRVFPSDRELPGHHTLLDPRRLSRLVQEAGLAPPRSVRRRRTKATLLRYKPERRSVWRVDLRLRDAEPSRLRFAARVLPPEEALRVERVRVRGGGVDASGVGPRLVASVERTGLLLEEWLDVETFGDRGLGHAREVGRLLARLHRASPEPTGAGPRPRVGVASREPLQPLLGLAPALWRSAERVPAPSAVADAWIHGDLHPDQLARRTDGSGWSLLDLDEVGPGDRARELAGWVVDALRADPSGSFAAASEELLAGYAEAGGVVPPERVLRAHAADVLVHAAAASVRRLEEGALDKAAVALATAHHLMGPNR